VAAPEAPSEAPQAPVSGQRPNVVGVDSYGQTSVPGQPAPQPTSQPPQADPTTAPSTGGFPATPPPPTSLPPSDMPQSSPPIPNQ
jgi:hypothetical protein